MAPAFHDAENDRNKLPVFFAFLFVGRGAWILLLAHVCSDVGFRSRGDQVCACLFVSSTGVLAKSVTFQVACGNHVFRFTGAHESGCLAPDAPQLASHARRPPAPHPKENERCSHARHAEER